MLLGCAIGAYAFYAISAIAPVFFVIYFFVIYFVKETCGKELEEMAYE
ncbi:hypothetical protein [Vreelandella glaciei]